MTRVDDVSETKSESLPDCCLDRRREDLPDVSFFEEGWLDDDSSFFG